MEESKNKDNKESVFKITLKSKNSDMNPIRGDFTKFEVGDKIMRLYNKNTIYEITSIKRIPISGAGIYIMNNDLNSNFFSQHEKRILQKYSDNNNFGECQFELKPIIRCGKLLKNTKKKLYINEIEAAFSSSSYHKFAVVDLSSIIYSEQAKQSSISKKIVNYKKHISYNEKRLDVISKRIEVFQSVLSSEPVEDSISELPF